jgi:hypothetical protein
MGDRWRAGTPAVERVWARLPIGARAVLEDELAPTDLQTLLLSLARTRAAHGETAGVELGDGGFTGWTAALMANAKERCLVSCIATERLTQLR